MEWSTDVHLVSLLQEYIAPEACVADFVCKQLTTDGQKDVVTVAICQLRKLYQSISMLFDRFLNCSGLNWTKVEEVDEAVVMLRNGMFDLMLGDRIRRMLLNQYEEVGDVRHRFEDFISVHAVYMESRCKDLPIWWDSINLGKGLVKGWISRGLAEDESFAELVLDWLEDGRKLQAWLRDYEGKEMLANNPAQENERVFSEEVAIEVMKFVKVSTGIKRNGQDLTSILGTRGTV